MVISFLPAGQFKPVVGIRLGFRVWTLWREMSGTLILVDQREREEGINSLRRVETLEGEIVHSRQGETWGDQLTLPGTRRRAGHL